MRAGGALAIALGTALGGITVAVVHYQLNRSLIRYQQNVHDQAERMDDLAQYNCEAPPDIAGAAMISEEERTILNDMEWNVGPSMDPRMAEIEDSVEGGEESSA